MIEKLVGKIIRAAKKNPRLLVPAVACLWILFTVDGAMESVKKRYGVSGPVLLLCCCVALGAVTAASTGPSLLRRDVPLAGTVLEVNCGMRPEETESLREEPIPAPNDPEHSDQAVSLPVNAVDKTDPEQNELLQTITRYVGMLQLNQVTPDWAPDLSPDGQEPANRIYYEKAWSAYEGLTEGNRAKLEAETLGYLMTCHRTVNGS